MFYRREIQLFLILLFGAVLLSVSVCEAEGLVYDRVRIRPSISLSEIYTDNTFLTHSNEVSEFITTLSPRASLDLAFSPGSYITFTYGLDYRIHSRFKNFKKDTHKLSLTYTWKTTKGSKVEVGTKLDLDFLQPYSKADRAKRFTLKRFYMDTQLHIGAFTEIGFNLGFDSRRFRDDRDERDDYDRTKITLMGGYSLFPASVIFIETSYSHQNNPRLAGLPDTDMDTYTIYTGVKWAPTSKLSGTLKAGYTKTHFKELNDFDGTAIDTDITYKYSEITHFNLRLFKTLIRSTRGARETGEYFISRGGGLSCIYTRWEPLTFTVDLGYNVKDFRETTADRKDKLYTLGLKTDYKYRQWLSWTLQYRYRKNSSNITTEQYRDNRFIMTISASI